MVTSERLGDGEFVFIKDQYTRAIYKNAHMAISATDMWSWLKSYEPVDRYMFTCHKNIKIIEKKMAEDDIYNSHSGGSFAMTLREMQNISIVGYSKFEENWILQFC
jgi:hypothetical protein